MPRSLILLDPTARASLAPLAFKAPNGYATLDTLGDVLLMDVLTHPDEAKTVTRSNFMIDLPNVDQNGYTVYDRTYTAIYTIKIDPSNPGLDLTQPLLRPMRFGVSLFDLDYVSGRQHGEVFYIGYDSGHQLSRILMVIVVDPLVT